MAGKYNNGPYNFTVEEEVTVEFYDCDPMKVVWHGNYINFFEAARRKLLENINYDYEEMEKSGYAFPVIDVSAKYLKPLYYRDRIIVKAILLEYENCLRIEFEIRNAKTGIVTTRGICTQMAFDIKKMESCFVCPKILIDKIEKAIAG